MNEGDIQMAMYRMAAKHFRLPVRLVSADLERVPFLPLPEQDSYIVHDDLDQRLGVMKIFVADDPEEEVVISRTMEGIKAIAALGLKDSRPATLIDFEQAKVETDNKQFIALFSLPEGRSMLAHIHYLLDQRGSSMERNQAVGILKNGYQQLAKALAELHSKGYSPICTISDYYWTSHMDVCRAVVKSLRAYVKVIPFNLDDFSDRLIRMAAAAYAKPCSAGVLHGRAFAGSVMYEPFSGEIALMDLENSFHSIDGRGMPCGPCAYDFVWAEGSFTLQMAYLDAPYDEVQEILYDYRQAYKTAMRDRYPSARHLTFYYVLFWLPIYKSLVAKYNGNESLMSEGEKRLFKEAYSKVVPVLAFAGAATDKPAV